MRWVASMVADVHRILTRGGVFLYPWDQREPDKPGKLRLMYEANPMAFLVEQAGGMATNGRRRILDIPPGKLHERVAWCWARRTRCSASRSTTILGMLTSLTMSLIFGSILSLARPSRPSTAVATSSPLFFRKPATSSRTVLESSTTRICAMGCSLGQ
jgi:hypothetical protein